MASSGCHLGPRERSRRGRRQGHHQPGRVAREQVTSNAESTTEFWAVGQDRIVTIHRVGEQETGRHEFSGENINVMVCILCHAASEAHMWNEPPCPACGAKRCRLWHDGLLLERREDGEARRFWVDGVTASGMHRLRPMAGGRPRYSRAWSPVTWGKIVGYHTVSAP